MLLFWCARRDLNSYVIQHTPLKRACLPIPALAQIELKSLDFRGDNIDIIPLKTTVCQQKTAIFISFSFQKSFVGKDKILPPRDSTLSYYSESFHNHVNPTQG